MSDCYWISTYYFKAFCIQLYKW